MIPQPSLPSGIQSNVSLVIEEKIQLDIGLSGLVEGMTDVWSRLLEGRGTF